MKKLLASLLAVTMLASMSTGVFAETHSYRVPENGEVVSTFTGEDGVIYEYVRYAEPVEYEYNGIRCTSLGKIRPKQTSEIQPLSDYREWKEYEIIDYGIVSKWLYKSNPYFVVSVAKGEVFERTIQKQVTISTKAGINVPAGSQRAIYQALEGSFSLGASGSYTGTITIQLTGPDDGNNTRSFYYRKAYHKHQITVIEQLYSNWDGLISEKEYDDCYGFEPVTQSYSEDSNV